MTIESAAGMITESIAIRFILGFLLAKTTITAAITEMTAPQIPTKEYVSIIVKAKRQAAAAHTILWLFFCARIAPLNAAISENVSKTAKNSGDCENPTAAFA